MDFYVMQQFLVARRNMTRGADSIGKEQLPRIARCKAARQPEEARKSPPIRPPPRASRSCKTAWRREHRSTTAYDKT